MQFKEELYVYSNCLLPVWQFRYYVLVTFLFVVDYRQMLLIDGMAFVTEFGAVELQVHFE